MQLNLFTRFFLTNVTALALGAASGLTHAQPIKLGQTLPLTGSGHEAALNMQAGVQAYMDKINAAGGIKGRKIELVLLDDGAKSKVAAENAEKLIAEQQVVALLGGFHGSTCAALAKLATEKSVPLISCSSGTPAMRDPSRFVFPVRASHAEEWVKMMKLAKSLGFSESIFIHEDTDNGRRHLANYTKSVSDNGLKLAKSHAVKGDISDTDIAALAQNILNDKPQLIVFQTAYAINAKLIKIVRSASLSTRFMVNNSGAEIMAKQMGADANGLIFTQVVPFPWKIGDKEAEQFRQDMKRYSPKADIGFTSYEGYLNAHFMVQALLNAKSITPEGIVEALERLGKVKYGRFEVSTQLPQRGSSDVDTVYFLGGKFVR